MEQMNILGVHVSATNMPEAVCQIKTWIANRTRTYVCVTGVHGIMECQDNLRLRTIHNSAGMVTPDGMPLVYISRAGGHARTTRVYGPDLMAAMCEDSVGSGYRHFFYGAAPATLAKLVERIGRRFPGIQIAGSYSPPYRDLSADELKKLSDLAADKVVVAPNPSLPDRVVATAWLNKQSCSGVDAGALRGFIRTRAGHGPGTDG